MVLEDTLYELCECVLRDFCFQTAQERLSIDELVEAVCQFLRTDKTHYEDIFAENDVEIAEEKWFYKVVMQYLVVSCNYKLALHEFANGIDVDINEQSINELETLSLVDILSLYSPENELLPELITGCVAYFRGNYLFQNDCLQSVISRGKQKQLLKINPFEITCLLQYLEDRDLSCSERIIRDITNMYDSVEYQLHDEEETSISFDSRIRDGIHQLLLEKYNGDLEMTSNIYRYILSNVYEYVKLEKQQSFCREDSQKLVLYFENLQTTWQSCLQRYWCDGEFFSQIMTYFLRNNGCDFSPGDLYYRRKDLENTDGVKILKKLHPYYDEEKQFFDLLSKSYY